MYTLYHYAYSQHARRVVSLLEEAGLNYKLHTIAMDQAEYLSPDYTAINPNQQIPTLIDGQTKIHESNAILRYLCLKHSLTTWYPEDLKQRALVEQWLDWNQCRMAERVIDIVLNKVFMGENADQAAIKRGEESIPELFKILNNGLQNSEYLAGATPSIADLSIASNIFQLSLAQVKPTETNLVNWYQRINLLEGFQKSLPPQH
ncbi:Glutathione S-transferase, unnamed subgroup [hydrothermal vent metagenome]|uniref:Glutathione S-transferase, unnamed subgroup n=1 Tax=hydrothermal vent metagenome TaxID=652676 RepID=A0A3B1ADF3_9ZZZZ